MKALIVVDYTVDFVTGKLPCGDPAIAIEGRIAELTRQFAGAGDFVVMAVDLHDEAMSIIRSTSCSRLIISGAQRDAICMASLAMSMRNYRNGSSGWTKRDTVRFAGRTLSWSCGQEALQSFILSAYVRIFACCILLWMLTTKGLRLPFMLMRQRALTRRAMNGRWGILSIRWGRRWRATITGKIKNMQVAKHGVQCR